MKKILASLIIVTICTEVSAQAGIYKSAEDYMNGTLEYTGQEFTRHRVRTDMPFNKYVVKVVDGNESHKFFKWDLYGFRNKRNEAFRFFNEKSYRIVDTTSFVIYAREELTVRGKEKLRETKYYFSKNAESRIIPLTIMNLKYAFPNREFHQLLDMQFRSNKELLRFDSYAKQYKLKTIYNMANG